VDPTGTLGFFYTYTAADGTEKTGLTMSSNGPAGLGASVVNAGGFVTLDGADISSGFTSQTTGGASEGGAGSARGGASGVASAQAGAPSTAVGVGTRKGVPTTWGESGTYLPGDGAFGGEAYRTAVATRGPRRGFVEAGLGFGALGRFQDAIGDIFVGQMLYGGAIAIALFGHGVGFFTYLPLLPFERGRRLSREFHGAVRAGRVGAMDAGAGRFRNAGDSMIRSLPPGLRNEFFSSE
jgi:hypothetical protein